MDLADPQLIDIRAPKLAFIFRAEIKTCGFTFLISFYCLQDSPVFNFINNLSPIPPPKPLDTAHNVQLFKSSDLAPVSSIFASPHVNPAKETKVLIRLSSLFFPMLSS